MFPSNDNSSRGSASWFEAAKAGSISALESLYKLGTPVDATDESGQLAIDYAVAFEQAPVVEFLIGLGATETGFAKVFLNDIDAIKSIRELHKLRFVGPLAFFGSAMHLAATLGRTEIVSHFIDAGMSATEKNPLDQTPLFLAASAGKLATAQVILDSLTDAEVLRREASNALIGAIFDDQEAAIQLLLKHHADPSSLHDVSFVRSSPLHVAVQNNRLVILRLLVEGEIHNIDVRDEFGATPLHVAVTAQCLDSVKILINAGASVVIPTADGETAIELADSEGNSVIQAFLAAV